MEAIIAAIIIALATIIDKIPGVKCSGKKKSMVTEHPPTQPDNKVKKLLKRSLINNPFSPWFDFVAISAILFLLVLEFLVPGELSKYSVFKIVLYVNGVFFLFLHATVLRTTMMLMDLIILPYKKTEDL